MRGRHLDKSRVKGVFNLFIEFVLIRFDKSVWNIDFSSMLVNKEETLTVVDSEWIIHGSVQKPLFISSCQRFQI
jgi:hypothetical protein